MPSLGGKGGARAGWPGLSRLHAAMRPPWQTCRVIRGLIIASCRLHRFACPGSWPVPRNSGALGWLGFLLAWLYCSENSL